MFSYFLDVWVFYSVAGRRDVNDDEQQENKREKRKEIQR